MKTTFFTFLVIMLSSFMAFSQHNHDHDHSHEHAEKNGHDHHRYEIGIANAPVYFINEKEFAYGLHAHLIYNFKDSPMGLGLGYERIFDEHQHNTAGIVLSYRPVNRLSLNVSPGITFESAGEDDGDSEHEKEYNFAVHFETTYEYEINNFHIGPVLEIAYDKEDVHISLGLHLGYGF